MKQNHIIILSVAATLVLLAVGFFFGQVQPKPVVLGSVEDIFSGSGTTNASTTVNTTSTQILDNTWTTFASISNNSQGTVFCYADGQTAPSSSVGLNAGFSIYPSSTGAGYVCFGRGQNCMPYIGRVNCIASTAGVLGIFKK